jgi:Domain of unknown function (DUF3883)
MPISDWWNRDPDQRFWMEATDREVLGEDLRAPLSGGDGQPVWHYELVSAVQPGDIVFHWHTTLLKRPALVGWSVAEGPLHEEMHPWTTHAGGNVEQAAIPRPNWIMPLGGIHFFENPIDNADLASIRQELLALRSSLASEYNGFRYFPFAPYGDGTNVRAVQAYATKFPAQLLALFRDLLSLDFEPAEATDSVVDATATKPIRAGSGQGFLRDTARRVAIEQHAVARAIKMYEGLGATDIEVLGKPYDIRLTLHGEEVHVEVKGSGQPVASVQITRNELSHAHTFSRVELVVVDAIGWRRNSDGSFETTGGVVRHWTTWLPTQESLTALTYEHKLPPLNDGAGG